MVALRQHFAELIQRSNPPEERLDLAKVLPASVRDHLKAHKLATIEPHTLLSGSYKRGTAVEDIKDVDILVFMEGLPKDWTPSELVNTVEDALEDYPDSEVETDLQRRSIHILFTEWDFHLDIVPTLMTGNDTSAPLWVPDRQKKVWIASHPLEYGRLLSKVNEDNAYKVIPLIKLLKVWRNANMVYMSPKSYWLECLVYDGLKKGAIDVNNKGLAAIFADLLNFLIERIKGAIDQGGVPIIFDPVLNNNVASGWEHSHAKSFLSRLQGHSKTAAQALGAETEDEAIALWQQIFGEDRFPTLLEGKEAELHKAVLAGSAKVSTIGTVFARTPSVNATPVKPVRAFGD